MSRTQQVAALRERYEGYLEGYRQRVIDNGPFRGLRKFVTGNSAPADRKADLAFYGEMEAAVAAFVPEDSHEAADAVRLMILETKGEDSVSDLLIEAVQALAIPLLSHLDREQAAAILADYKARYPKKRMLTPRQRELLAALEQAAN